MIKITDITEKKLRTIYVIDEYGNRVRDVEEYTIKRPVKSIESVPRFVHFVIDFFIFHIIFYIGLFCFGLLINTLNDYDNSLFSFLILSVGIIFVLSIHPALYAFCEYKWQKTPGKYLTKTIVIDEYGNKPDLRTIIIRSLLRLVPFEILSCLGDNHSLGWHDKYSKTWVVSHEELKILKELQLKQS